MKITSLLFVTVTTALIAACSSTTSFTSPGEGWDWDSGADDSDPYANDYYDSGDIDWDAGEDDDASASAVDSGAPSIDAGVAVNDAGDPGIDAGVAVNDAGDPGTDAGAVDLDAGDPGIDAGATDAGKKVCFKRTDGGRRVRVKCRH